jgi:DNA-directed RNA polymerase specialized sigma24 family protein
VASVANGGGTGKIAWAALESEESARLCFMSRRPTDHRRLSALGLARLLTRLDADVDRAALEYERLRQTLVRFFDLRGAWPPEECADESLDRLAHKLASERQADLSAEAIQAEAIQAEGVEAVEDVRRYAHGIARLVLLERLRKPAPASMDDEQLANLAAPAANSRADGDENDSRQECFDCCLDALPAEQRSLALKYYVAVGQAKIDNRRSLARALQITDNALRRRVQRIRERLERCTHECTTTAATLGLDEATRLIVAMDDTPPVKGRDDA